MKQREVPGAGFRAL